MELYIGLMSGTSADGIDAAVVDFSQPTPNVVATYFSPHTAAIKEKIHALCEPGTNEIHRLGELDSLLGHAFANAVEALLNENNLSASDIIAIGSHGQTIRHVPHEPYRFTLQIGDPNIIAAQTGITTVADFRRKDMALGGHGAPLVPAFHQSVLADKTKDRAVVNIGGIANITLLRKDHAERVLGFDTGPGNVLMDSWIAKHKQKSHDESGLWAASGKINTTLLDLFVSDAYFDLPPPKSTGREYFNLKWIEHSLKVAGEPIASQDVQATLAELTASTILEAIKKYLNTGEIIVCGGGAKNHYLLSRLAALSTPHFTVTSSSQYGLDPDWMEAIAFAWLAKQTLDRKPGNMPSVTGAKQAVVLGGVYFC